MTLQTVWCFLWGLLWAVYLMTDGFDLGIGMLLPFLGRDETRRRTMVHAMGPLWNGNEVWLLTAGGVTFAAFPAVYAAMFSALYAPLMLILFALIVRGIAVEFRDKVDSPGWRALWDRVLLVGSLLPILLLGVAFANLFRGLLLDQSGYHGTLISLLNPYGLAGGVLFVLMATLHGALWLAAKTSGDLQREAAACAGKTWVALLIVAVIFLAATWFDTPLYRNYLAQPVLFLVPLLAVAALLATRVFLAQGKLWPAWGASAVTIVAVTFFGVIGLFPNMLMSRTDPSASLTALNASSSPLTLTIMLTVVAIFVPLVLIYQGWAYRLFAGQVTEEEAAAGEGY